MRGSLPVIVARRLVALAATIVIAPTVAYVVFGALSGSLGQSVPAAAEDYVVRTFWHFDLGISGRFNGPISEVLTWTFPVDVTMVFGGLLVGMALGLAGGLVAVARPGTWVSRALQGLGMFLLCCPPYWLPFMLLIFFAPGVAMLVEIPFLSTPNLYRDEPHGFLGWAQLLWLPVLLVALPVAAQILRMTIVSVRDVGDQNFIATARAKGLSEGQVLRRHMLPLVLAPVTALTAANVALVITNVTLVEAAWNMPGLYRELRDVASLQDTDTVQALIIQTTVFIVVANMLADAVQAWLDPTVRG
ncbi:MAG TPA: ABC transporter permease [Solirubrobacteraceae bacterium]|nr:ABC transporter permease [Solirubrobacteraceae bacterium]